MQGGTGDERIDAALNAGCVKLIKLLGISNGKVRIVIHQGSLANIRVGNRVVVRGPDSVSYQQTTHSREIWCCVTKHLLPHILLVTGEYGEHRIVVRQDDFDWVCGRKGTGKYAKAS